MVHSETKVGSTKPQEGSLHLVSGCHWQVWPSVSSHRFLQCSDRSPASRWGSWLHLAGGCPLSSRSRWCHGLLRLLGLAVNLLLYSMLALRRRSSLRFGVSHGGAMGHKDARAPLGQGTHPRYSKTLNNL